jgi:hypothetical protein
VPASFKPIAEQIFECDLDTAYGYLLEATSSALANRGHPAAAALRHQPPTTPLSHESVDDLASGDWSAGTATGLSRASTAPAATVELLLEGHEIVDAVGESHYQTALLRACGASRGEDVHFACRAHLVPEPDNPYDENAVAVHVSGARVGHLARAEAARWQPMLLRLTEQGEVAMCEAVIAGHPSDGATDNLGIFLHLPSLAEARTQLALRRQ